MIFGPSEETCDPDEWVGYLSGATVAAVIMAGRRLW